VALPEKPQSGNNTWVHCLIHSSILAKTGLVDRKSKKHFFISLDSEKVREWRSRYEWWRPIRGGDRHDNLRYVIAVSPKSRGRCGNTRKEHLASADSWEGDSWKIRSLTIFHMFIPIRQFGKMVVGNLSVYRSVSLKLCPRQSRKYLENRKRTIDFYYVTTIIWVKNANYLLRSSIGEFCLFLFRLSTVSSTAL
jgi:hypothetical protein